MMGNGTQLPINWPREGASTSGGMDFYVNLTPRKRKRMGHVKRLPRQEKNSMRAFIMAQEICSTA